jgi:hypothetical protein
MITGFTSETLPYELAALAGAERGLLANFAKYTGVNEEGCWIWSGALNASGSPKARDGDRTVEVYRALHDHVLEPIPKGKFAVRTCTNQLCVHPSHVRAGELAETRNREPAKTCRQGHDTSTPDTRVGGTMAGHCKVCAKERSRKHREGLAD